MRTALLIILAATPAAAFDLGVDYSTRDGCLRELSQVMRAGSFGLDHEALYAAEYETVPSALAEQRESLIAARMALMKAMQNRIDAQIVLCESYPPE
ncbi:hypothetical protein [Ponticoccus litoralis]|uniref:Uncharacterized protein n=1 Tax=Ponticoccus litoralis TaxID=422297 RepID=A0AAW9SDE3_9RHOB